MSYFLITLYIMHEFALYVYSFIDFPFSVCYPIGEVVTHVTYNIGGFHMIKKLSFLLALVYISTSIFTACTSKIADVTGTTWVLSSWISPDGQEITSEIIELELGEITYEFKEDGIVLVLANGQSGEASWSQYDDEITISGNTTSAVAKIDGNRFVMENEGHQMVFIKIEL